MSDNQTVTIMLTSGVDDFGEVDVKIKFDPDVKMDGPVRNGAVSTAIRVLEALQEDGI